LSRVGVHGADGETAATAASYWNKSPQLRPCHDSMDPDAVVVLVGVWSRGSIADSMGYLGAQGLPLLLLVGGFAGFLSCQASQLAVVKAVAALLCKVVGMAKRSAERRLKDLDQFPGSLRRAPGLDQRSTGHGPRPTGDIGLLPSVFEDGELLRLRSKPSAMVFSLVLGFYRPLKARPGVFLGEGFRRRLRWLAAAASTELPKDFNVFFLFSRWFCVFCVGRLSPLQPSRRCLYALSM